MNDENRDRLSGHEYDGIGEYNNPMPSWWAAMFIGTILFALGYFIYFHGGGPGVSPAQSYNIAMKAWQQRQDAEAARLDVTDDALSKLMTDGALMAEARSIYLAKCAVCHGPQGGGLIGPNLADKYWIHGGKLADIYKTIRDGVPDKGMLAWKQQISPKQIMQMAAFVGTLQGTNPANAKAPQGDPAEPAWLAANAVKPNL